jgi:hypothetical protein
MAVKVNKDELDEGQGGGDYEKETKFIEEGTHPARLVYYAELGKHFPIFKGKRATYDSGKKAGQHKPAELMIHLVFEFPTAPYDFNPLCIKTSIPFGDNGEFINKLPVSDALASGKISLSFANRSKYMKFLNAMNKAAGTNHQGLHEHIGNAFLIAVTNKYGQKADEDGNIPVYANMKPEGIQKTSFKHPATGKIEDIDVPEIQGTYGPVFDWDNPTKESWEAMPEYLRNCIQRAENYEGSEVHMLVSGLYDIPKEGEELPQENTGRPADAEPMPDDDIPF